MKKGQEFLAYYDKQTFIGLTYTIYTDSLVYLLFLAVEESKQSQGYGSQILAQVKKEAFAHVFSRLSPWIILMFLIELNV